MWFDGDVRRHYFSSKITFNKWVKEFVEEVMNGKDYYDYQLEKLKGKSKNKNLSMKEIIKYFSSSNFLEKIELDI